jgi:cysteine desulfurase
MIYLDNNATTRPLVAIFEGIEGLLDVFGNPSSPHKVGNVAREVIELSRLKVARVINSSPKSVLFTSGGTESIAFAFALTTHNNPQSKIIVSQVEHVCIFDNIELYKKKGFECVSIGVTPNGDIDLDAFEKAIGSADKPSVSMMLANNETGVIFPIAKIGEMVRNAGGIFHVDAVQGIGKISIDVEDLNCDLLSISAHKFHGIKGAGALYVGPRVIRLNPLIPGHHEKGLRGGTENTLGIWGMGAAADHINFSLSQQTQVSRIRDRLENAILSAFPGAEVNGNKLYRLSNTANIFIPKKEASMVVQALDAEGICVSAGSACTTGQMGSHVLSAMGFPEDRVNCSIRISLSTQTTEEDVEVAEKKIIDVISRLPDSFSTI